MRYFATPNTWQGLFAVVAAGVVVVVVVVVAVLFCFVVFLCRRKGKRSNLSSQPTKGVMMLMHALK